MHARQHLSSEALDAHREDERIEAERRGDRRPQVRVGVDVVEHPAAVVGVEIFDASDIEIAARTIRGPCRRLRRNVRIWQELDGRRRVRRRSAVTQMPVAIVWIADWRRAQVEASVRFHPHRIEQLSAEKLQANDALVGVVRQVLLQQEQIVGEPHRRIGGEEGLDLRQRLDDLDARAAAALIGLEQRRPAQIRGVGLQRRSRR